ncbi:hypothetical protein IFR05_007890 [Cadophora sp. M221]|nr:hypothetical protein IFR05_007890 [Cadophora sp. M221]
MISPHHHLLLLFLLALLALTSTHPTLQLTSPRATIENPCICEAVGNFCDGQKSKGLLSGMCSVDTLCTCTAVKAEAKGTDCSRDKMQGGYVGHCQDTAPPGRDYCATSQFAYSKPSEPEKSGAEWRYAAALGGLKECWTVGILGVGFMLAV